MVSFNLALKGTLEDNPQPSVKSSKTSNIVTLSLTDDLPPPPPELNETVTSVDSAMYPPSECAPPPPPPYPFPSSNESSPSKEDHHPVSPIPAPVLQQINNQPSLQLKQTITRIFKNRSQASNAESLLQVSMQDASALRFSLSVFGAQDLTSDESKIETETKFDPSLCNMEDTADRLVDSCRAMLTSVGQIGKSVFASAANEAVVCIAETANFLLDLHSTNNGSVSISRITHLASALTNILDAFNCCLQTGSVVVEEQMLSGTTNNFSEVLNEKLRQMLLNSSWLARSLAVFYSLAIQMKQEGHFVNTENIENKTQLDNAQTNSTGESSSSRVDGSNDNKEEATLGHVATTATTTAQQQSQQQPSQSAPKL